MGPLSAFLPRVLVTLSDPVTLRRLVVPVVFPEAEVIFWREAPWMERPVAALE